MSKLYINFGGRNINEFDCKLKIKKNDLPWIEKYRPNKIDDIFITRLFNKMLRHVD